MRRWATHLSFVFLLLGAGCEEQAETPDSPDAGSAADAGLELVVPEEVPAAEDPSLTLYSSKSIPEFTLGLSDEALASLETDPRTYVEGSFTYNGRTYAPVGIRLKGQSSFLPITSKASFKVKFDEFIDSGEFLELEELTLNNMSSDPTMLRERLSYLMYREAGVPAPRCNHANVYVNDTYYGVYANVENVDDRLMARWFEDGEGPLYEGWDVDFLPELVETFEHEDGPDDRTMLEGLAQALALEPPEAAVEAAAVYVDWAAFRRFWAVTVAVGQFDAYPYHLDDFHVYADPSSGRLAFIPWGTDESFDPRWHVGWISGRVAVRCAQVETCLYAWGYETLDMADMLEAKDLLGTLDAVAVEIAPFVAQDVRKPYTAEETAAARAEMRTFIAERKATILEQFGVEE